MKLKLLIIILIGVCSFSTLYSQKSKTNPNGYNIYYYPNGNISSEGNMKRGKPDGYWITYYTTGIKKSEGNRKNTLLDSIWTFYDETGNVIKKINYRNGKKNGFTEKFSYKNNPEGTLFMKTLFINNKKEGKAYYYYDNGDIKKIENYEDGVLEGKAYEYDKKGVINTIYYYKKGNLYDIEKINRFNEKGQKTGTWKIFYESGRVKQEKIYKKGKVNGLAKEYNKLGELVLALEYKEDKVIKKISEDSIRQVVDIREETYPNGKKKYSGSFIYDVPVGIHRQYDKYGKVTSSKIYSDKGVLLAKGILTDEGKREGEWNYYYTNGNIKYKGKYIANSRNGIWTFYHENGIIYQEGEYKNGRYHGVWKWYYQDGKKLRIENYYNGTLEGEYIEYNDSGKIIAKGLYIEDEKDGKWVYNVGDHKEIGNYVMGLRDGRWKHYYLSNGSIRFTGKFVRGKPDKKHKYYHDNGKLMEVRYYDMGRKIRNWTKYNREGKAIITVIYKNNKEYMVNGRKV